MQSLTDVAAFALFFGPEGIALVAHGNTMGWDSMDNYERYFLGGADLEMETVLRLLQRQLPSDRICDRSLSWGARTSAYLNEIHAALNAGYDVVCIELLDDLPDSFDRTRIAWIDHHGDRAGRTEPSSLRQVFTRLGCANAEWTREFSLVEANDIGHIAAMLRLNPPASREEMIDIRQRDRTAQGIGIEEENSGWQAAMTAIVSCQGRLTSVPLPHNRTATVADALTRELGGPGFETLLIHTPSGTTVFGIGPVIACLSVAYPGGWWGGDMPHRGFWGSPLHVPQEQIEQIVTSCATNSGS